MTKDEAKLLKIGDKVAFRSVSNALLTGTVIGNKTRTIFGTPIIAVAACVQTFKISTGEEIGNPVNKVFDLKPHEIFGPVV